MSETRASWTGADLKCVRDIVSSAEAVEERIRKMVWGAYLSGGGDAVMKPDDVKFIVGELDCIRNQAEHIFEGRPS